MVITIDINRRELRQIDLAPQDIEEIVWGMVGEYLDPEEMLNADLDINVHD